jgi:hypothetical protein
MKRGGVIGLAVVLACSQVSAAQTVDDPPPGPSRRVIEGVPFIAWSEAAQLEYHNRAILNPSFAASLGMILEYWGQDLTRLKKPAEALPSGEDAWGRTESAEAGGVADLKAFIDRGIPVSRTASGSRAARQAGSWLPLAWSSREAIMTPEGIGLAVVLACVQRRSVPLT